MSERARFEGCGTALVTPFAADGGVDERALARLVDFQIDAGVDFLVPCGTTGESVTLTRQERLRVVGIVRERAAGRVPILAGAGGNDTRRVIDLARRMEQLGVDGLLSVTPYYNKPTQEGLYRHYEALSEAVALPIVLYNVPGRTACNLLPATVLRLAELDRVVGIKEASGNIVQISELASGMPAGFQLLSGDDGNVLPLIALGGCGVISVVSNVAPALMSRFVRACLDEDYPRARESLANVMLLTRAMFLETNPAPAKAALALLGRIGESCRLPLAPMGEENRRELRRLLEVTGVLKPAGQASRQAS